MSKECGCDYSYTCEFHQSVWELQSLKDSFGSNEQQYTRLLSVFETLVINLTNKFNNLENKIVVLTKKLEDHNNEN